ncbi:Uncharacterized conserved protein, contains FHA domain [Pragia fontium]|uniref:type VI secretion system-associated FHA domain protein TagH n=1 Tax=Pragia fontium TaxID=82985 RepID=UPI000DFFB598|nr:type VI secretion system-associated FHA domain protein TagH [Pragia fontium]SUB81846.1 Uncharacterized conserved protein, contains FHA domain [Pragia fontium]
MNNSNTLTLQILNHECLASGKHGNTLIDQEGATIGSNADNFWSIQNQRGQIEPLHAKVDMVDSHFCISAYAPGLYLNDVDLFAKAKPVRLQHGDIMKLSDFKIKVQVNPNGTLYQDPLSIRPENIISNHHDPINEILSKKVDSVEEYSLTELQQTPVLSSLPLDPMKVLDAAQPTTQFTINKVPPVVTTQNVLEQSIRLEGQSNNDFTPLDNDLNHLAINPLFQGLQHSINLKDSKEAYDLLEEIGHSIKSVVEGLSSLHAANLYSSDKHLRPIEDNPLHLNLSYDEMLKLLYSTEKCPVHLSAPSAFAESLCQIRLHHTANQRAISEALAALLQAFSPQALITRFLRYRRASEKSTPDGSWAWEMYSSYFDELTSNRQQGFEKLFWEIYEQSYDRHIRQLQQEVDGKDPL